MDSASVISLSSASSKKSENLNSIVTLSSESRRVPVSWKNPNKIDIFQTEKTPNNSEKVNSWMQTCTYSPQKLSEPNVKSTCIRYDFDKAPKTVTVQKSCYTKTTPLFSYMEEAKKFSNMNAKNKNESLRKFNGNKGKEDFSSPLSPDSQKKELCNYLQLMKPDEKQNSYFIEYRRSGRVRKQNQNINQSKNESQMKDNEKKRKVSESQHPALKSFRELNLNLNKLKNITNIKRKRFDGELSEKLLPLPPLRFYSEITDFEESIKDIVDLNKEESSQKVDEILPKKDVSTKNGCLKKVQKRRKFKFGVKLHQKLKGQFIYKRINLRSKRRVKNMSLDTLFKRKNHIRRKARKKIMKKRQEHKFEDKNNLSEKVTKTNLSKLEQTEKKITIESPRCEIISVYFNSDDENIDLRNFVDDMLELELMSEEHRKSVIESRILASSSITNLINKRKEEADVQKAFKIFSELSNERKSCDDAENTQEDDLTKPEIEEEYVNKNNTQDHVENENEKVIENDQEEQQEEGNRIESDVNQNLIINIVSSEHDYAIVKPLEVDEYENEGEEDEDVEEKLEEDDKNLEEKLEEDDQNLEEKLEEDDKNLEEIVNKKTDFENSHAQEAEKETLEVKEVTESIKNLSPVPIPEMEVLPFNKEGEMKNLHRSLTLTNRRKSFINNCFQNWSSNPNLNRRIDHAITISSTNGEILCGFYQEFNLVICQKTLISFWTQSSLGNVMGAQNMWIPKGEIPRITLNSTYTRKNAMDMVITTETSIAFVELWTKEHKSEVREVPLADVFATVYFWRLRQNGLDKKALQLENIQGFADDVQYSVLRSYPRIIVSWHCLQGTDKKTKIRSYHLAADFQTVANISEIQPVQHYVKSLHNIEDCDSLIMGCGENKVTLWNVEYGYIVATVEMTNISLPLSTLWVKCDRGFLFIIQETDNRELRLIAINGMNYSWKKLQIYSPPSGFDGLKGVYVENGIVVGYYSQGILCWNAQNGVLIVEESPYESEYISSGKYVIMIVNENIVVRHSLSQLLTDL